MKEQKKKTEKTLIEECRIDTERRALFSSIRVEKEEQEEDEAGGGEWEVGEEQPCFYSFREKFGEKKKEMEVFSVYRVQKKRVGREIRVGLRGHGGVRGGAGTGVRG